MLMSRTTAAFCVALLLGWSLQAQPTMSPTLPRATEAPTTASSRFESLAAGIALTAPADCKIIRDSAGTQLVVSFTNDEKRWNIKLSRVILESDKPLPLSTWRDSSGIERPGMLEYTTNQFKTEVPGAEILRQDVVQLAQASAGLMIAKYSYSLETNLLQQATIRSSDLQYYMLSMTTPAPREGTLQDNPSVREAVEAFSQMLDTVKLLDQSELRIDREDRLYRTRALYANLTERKYRASLRKEMWFRHLLDGKDVGYSYMIQEIARDLPRKGQLDLSTGPEGVLVGVRTRMVPEPGAQTDSESWFFSTFDRKYESFSTVVYSQNANGAKSTAGEVGAARWLEKAIAIAADPNQLLAKKRVGLDEQYRLEVTRLGPSPAPIERELPPYYLPQAVGRMLPQLLPLREPKGYLFAAWVSEMGQVAYRYLDVGKEDQYWLGERRMRAIPIVDRIGLEGPPTTHYVSPEGIYLGNFNDQTKVTTLATDAANIERIWSNANLTRPGEVEKQP
jgi:hypothetical protein